MGIVQNYHGLLICRLFLGVAGESIIVPTMRSGLQLLTSILPTQRLASILESLTISPYGILVTALNIVRLCSSVPPVSLVPFPGFWRTELPYVAILRQSFLSITNYYRK